MNVRPWHQQAAWRASAQSALNYYLGKRDHTLIFSERHGVAAVHLERKTVFIHPDLFPAHPEARHVPLEPRALRIAQLEGLIAHEAGHVHFSGAFPGDARHFALVNALEDERIERLMVRRSPALAMNFSLLGDLCALQGEAKWSGSSLEGCLVWRWEHDRPASRWVSAEPEVWAEVRPLVEAAWVAPSTARVNWIARMILELLGEAAELPSVPDFGAYPGGRGAGSGGEEPSGEDEAGSSGKDEEPSGEDEAGSSGKDEEPGGEDEAGSSGKDEEPGGEDEAGSSGEDALGGGGVSEAPRREDWPQDAEPGEVTPHPRRLAALLRPPERPGRRVSHASRGRYDYDRAARGSHTPYRRRQDAQRPLPRHLSVLLDVSGSMEGETLRLASSAAVLLLRAATLARVRFDAWSFAMHPTRLSGTLSAEGLEAALLRLEANGGTRLAPALEGALSFAPRGEEGQVMVVLCDGQLEARDQAAVASLMRGAPHLRFLMVLIGAEATLEGGWGALRGEVRRGAAHFVTLEDPARLLGTLEAALLALSTRSA